MLNKFSHQQPQCAKTLRTYGFRLQWLLRDDSRRVDYNRARIKPGYPDWNKLFEDLGRRYGFYTLSKFSEHEKP